MSAKNEEKLDDVLLQLFDSLSPRGREIMLQALRDRVERVRKTSRPPSPHLR